MTQPMRTQIVQFPRRFCAGIDGQIVEQVSRSALPCAWIPRIEYAEA
jgi:hypothetical protein